MTPPPRHRRDEVATLREALGDLGKDSTVLLTGGAGVDKTAITRAAHASPETPSTVRSRR